MPRTSISGHRDPADGVPQRVGEVGLLGADLGPPSRKRAVAPHPAAVVLLHGVVEDAPAQRRLGAGGVELDRAGEELVEARRTSPGPSTNADDGLGLARPSTPGVTSTSTSRADQLGVLVGEGQRRSCPPSDMPTTASASGASAAIAAAMSSALACDVQAARAMPPSEWPWPGRSMATSGRPRARATVSHVWAFWAPPCRSTSSGGPSPHTSALSRRPGSTSTDSRRTTGGPS